MNEQQYNRLLQNRRRPGFRQLGEASPRSRSGQSPLACVLGQAAKRWRCRTLAAGAWERIADQRWLGDATVEGVEGDALVVSVRSTALRYELTRQQAALERQLAALVPRVRRLRIVDVDPGRRSSP